MKEKKKYRPNIIDVAIIQIFVVVVGLTTIINMLKLYNDTNINPELLAWTIMLFGVTLAYINIRLPMLLIGNLKKNDKNE